MNPATPTPISPPDEHGLASRVAGGVLRVVEASVYALGSWLGWMGLTGALAVSAVLAPQLGAAYWPTLVATGALGIVSAVAVIVTLVRVVRRPARSLGTLRLLLYAVALVWALHAFGHLPVRRVSVFLSGAICSGLVATTQLLPDRINTLLRGRGLRLLDFVAWVVVSCVAGGEFALRTVAELAPNPLLDVSRSPPAERLAAHRYQPGEIRHGFASNSRGYYDQEFVAAPDEKVVASIADSFGPGVVPLPYHFSQVIEGELEGVEVFNFGVPAIGPDEYLHLLVHEVLPMHPDLVVVNIFLGNDLRDLRGREFDDSWKLWFDLEQWLVSVAPRRLRLLREENQRLQNSGIPQESEAHFEEPPDEATLLEEFPWIADPMLEEPTFSLAAFLRMESARIVNSCLAGDAVFLRIQDCMASMVEAAGSTPLAFVLIPDEFQVEDQLWKLATRSKLVRHRDPERDRPQRLILEWCESKGVDCLDLLPHLRATLPLEDGRLHLYHLQDSHFNARGNRVAGEAVAQFLREHPAIR